MNRLNWIQQEQKVADYHVLTWSTSHFHHPRNNTDRIGSFGSKLEGGAGAAASMKQQSEGIAPGSGDAGSTRWHQGGLGSDGMAQYGVKDAAGNEVMSTAHRTQGKHINAPEHVTAVMQSVVPEEMYSVVNSARSSLHKVHNRIRQSMNKMRDIFLKQQRRQKTAGTSLRQNDYRKQPERDTKGTRRADRETVMSMQAQNHYLLDSYDRKGQYSTLGK